MIEKYLKCLCRYDADWSAGAALHVIDELNYKVLLHNEEYCSQSTDNLPSWVWPVLAVLVSLIVGQAVAIFLLRGREEQHEDGNLVQQPDERPYVSFEYEDRQLQAKEP